MSEILLTAFAAGLKLYLLEKVSVHPATWDPATFESKYVGC